MPRQALAAFCIIISMQREIASTVNRRFIELGFFATANDSRRLELEVSTYIVLLYTLLACALLGLVSPWAFVLVPLIYTRFALAEHELMHAPGALRVNALVRLMALFQSPFTLGYPQLREIHLGHHRHLGTLQDPERYLIEASHAQALARGLLANEIAFFRWIRANGWTTTLVAQEVLRGAMFFGLLCWRPTVFLWYLLSLRLSIGVGEFVFHHLLHLADAAERATRVNLPAFARATAGALLGADKVAILLEHDVHHAFPQVVSRHLATAGALARDIEATRGTTRAAPGSIGSARPRHVPLASTEVIDGAAE